MDPLRLLSRSTKLSKKLDQTQNQQQSRTSFSGQNTQSRLFPVEHNDRASRPSKRRKQEHDTHEETPEPNFFERANDIGLGDLKTSKSHKFGSRRSGLSVHEDVCLHDEENDLQRPTEKRDTCGSIEDAKKILKRHDVKCFWLNPNEIRKKANRETHKRETGSIKKQDKIRLFPPPVQSFRELTERYKMARAILNNIEGEGYSVPTEVQLGSLGLLLGGPSIITSLQKAQGTSFSPGSGIDLLAVAPTGSGKTLAFMITLLHKIKTQRVIGQGTRNTSAVILAPTKELAAQIVNEGRKLSRDTGIRVALVKKGMRLASRKVFTSNSKEDSEATIVRSDILVSTPGVLSSIYQETSQLDPAVLTHVRYLVLDEADVLLDPIFREQTLSVWKLIGTADLQVSLWSATMGSNIEELARSFIDERRCAFTERVSTDLCNAPIVRLVVGLKDSAVPNVKHQLVYAASEQGKLMGLRQLLHPTATSTESNPLLPPFLVFTQTVERAAALYSELRYDIPIEAGGVSRIAVLHSNLSDSARDNIMTRFRKGEVWVLITTDLLSRGVDFRGVNGVVNYDIPTSSAAYVHRVGRTGRAGRDGGVAITLYTEEDIAYLKPIANLVSAAQRHKNASSGVEGKDSVQKWLLDALPNLGKKTKQDLKKRGVESRTVRAKVKDPKVARRSRISTKSGFMRQEANRHLDAVSSSRKRLFEVDDASNEDVHLSDFAGFD